MTLIFSSVCMYEHGSEIPSLSASTAGPNCPCGFVLVEPMDRYMFQIVLNSVESMSPPADEIQIEQKAKFSNNFDLF